MSRIFPTVMRPLILFALFLVFALSLRPALAEEATPALWKVENGQSTLYLLGTFHLMKPGVHWYGGAIASGFESADTLVLELNQQEMNPATIQAIIAEQGVYPPPDNLGNHLDAETYAKLIEIGGRIGLNGQMLNPFKPWYASLVVSVSYFQSLGYLPQYGADATLMVKATETGTPIIGLETADEQILALSSYSDEVQVAFLADTIRQLDEVEGLIDDMTTAWKTGDTDALDTLLVKSMQAVPEVYEKLIVERNNKWMPKLEAMLDEPGTVFVAVGAGHLVGADGVVTMLEEKGYSITRQ